MGNPENFSRLKQGVKAWNSWREKDPNTRPQLSGADLAEAKLNGIFLTGTNLAEASFWRASLRQALFWKANLENANLSRANLREANLSGANLSGAVLWRAKLVGALNLTVEQLAPVKTISKAEIDEELRLELKENYPHIFQLWSG